jgi:serine/threonine protein kinase
MAEVYAARVRGEAGFQKLVAVKRMLPQLADDDEFVTMFLDEARLAANINSPHCVQTLELGRHDDGSLYIVMELVVGVTLARILRHVATSRHAVPIPVAVEIIAQAAEGLHDAHMATTPVGSPLHIVHRDVSPQNVLIGVDGRVRLTDFGVARAVLRSTQTVAGRIKGKFAYCSPEQLIGDAVDQRSDVFSLGVVGWEFLVGQRLFLGDHPMETMEKVRVMPVPTVHQVRPEVPEAVSDVIAWALEREIEKRAPSARDLATNLRDAVRAAGFAQATRDDIGRFVRAGGGEALAKMRDNIKRALSSERALGDAESEALLTPSGVKSGISTVMQAVHQPDPTDPQTGTVSPRPAFPDASAPSAAAVPAALIPPREPKPRTSLFWVFAISAIVTALGVGGAVGAVYLAMNDDEPTSIELAPVAVPSPARDPALGRVESETVAPPSPEPPELARGPLEPEGSGVAATMDAPARTDEARAETDEARAETDEARAETDEARPRENTSMRRVAAAMRAERIEPVPAAMIDRGSMSTRMSGIVGLDLFDEGVERR